MRLIFKYIAIFLPFSLFTQEVDQIEVVKVEVASIIWKNQKTSEKFPTVDSNILAEEVLVIESLDKPNINLETIEIDESRICLLYTSPSPRDKRQSRMPSSA